MKHVVTAVTDAENGIFILHGMLGIELWCSGNLNLIANPVFPIPQGGR